MNENLLLVTRRRRIRLRVIRGNGTLLQIEAIIRNPYVTARELALIAQRPEVYLRAMVAAHPRTSPETLEALACDESKEVRRFVRRNPAAHEQARILLALQG